MTFEQFGILQANLLDEVTNMGNTKGKEYANSKDRLANFKRLAIGLELHPEQVCWVYTRKHLDAIESYCREGTIYSEEGIRGRIVDAICYLTLLWGIINEPYSSLNTIQGVSQELKE